MLKLPPALELYIRESTDDRLIFLLDYGSAAQTATLHRAMTDLLMGERLEGAFVLEPFGVRVLSELQHIPADRWAFLYRKSVDARAALESCPRQTSNNLNV